MSEGIEKSLNLIARMGAVTRQVQGYSAALPSQQRHNEN
jgi:hypothetical protein